MPSIFATPHQQCLVVAARRVFTAHRSLSAFGRDLQRGATGFSTTSSVPRYEVVEKAPKVEGRHLLLNDTKKGQTVSFWHGVPLQSEGTPGLFNMICEIPRFTREKMEVQLGAELNPIQQDRKKDGSLRIYAGPIFWNYGTFPRTWEDPAAADHNGVAELRGLPGDGDPIDVVDVGQRAMSVGQVDEVKVLGALCLIDEDEVDWKILVVRKSDPHFAKLNNVDDIDVVYPHTTTGMREWFRWYKMPLGSAMNKFAFEGRLLNRSQAEDVVHHTHDQYEALVGGLRCSHGLNLWLGKGKNQ